MSAGLTLRLSEFVRRGGLWVLGVAALLVGFLSAVGEGTNAARYSFGTDVAAALAYAAALFYGALPLASDRERGRLLIPFASPVHPMGFALGNALGAAAIGALWGFGLFGAAATGGTLAGGWEVRPSDPLTFEKSVRVVLREGQEKPLALTQLTGYERIRIPTRAEPSARIEMTPAKFILEANGTPHNAAVGHRIDLPVDAEGICAIRNRTRGLHIVLDMPRAVGLGPPQGLFLVAWGAAAGPGLGCAAVGALAATASAFLASGVAALLVAALVLLGAMRGFLLETIAFRGAVSSGHAHTHAHDHGHDGGPAGLERVSADILEPVLAAVPDLGGLDVSAATADGMAVALPLGAGTRLLVITLILSVLIGGLGLRTRRLE